MHSFLVWLESTCLSTWIREEPYVYAFPAILSLHTIGMGLVAGMNTALGLRILGVAPRVPLMEMERFFPVMWLGFWLNAVSGVFLLIGYPTKAVTNPVFYTKLTFIAIALVVFRSIRGHVFRSPSPDAQALSRKGRLLAGASLACWAGAIAAGRLLAYTYHKLTSS